VAAGEAVRVASSVGEVVLPARLSRGQAAGTVVVAFNQPSYRAGTLIDAGSVTTAVSVTPAQGGNAHG
jgi:formylmethanofuran dehydrogenase subunit D